MLSIVLSALALQTAGPIAPAHDELEALTNYDVAALLAAPSCDLEPQFSNCGNGINNGWDHMYTATITVGGTPIYEDHFFEGPGPDCEEADPVAVVQSDFCSTTDERWDAASGTFVSVVTTVSETCITYYCVVTPDPPTVALPPVAPQDPATSPVPAAALNGLLDFGQTATATDLAEMASDWI